MSTEADPSRAEPGSPRLSPSNLVRIQAAALNALADRLDGAMVEAFEAAIDLLLRCVNGKNHVIVTGVGKSGLIGRKIAATLCSTGVPAHFLHPSDAIHGDMGMIAAEDVLLALSSSGMTHELIGLLPMLRHLKVPVVALCGSRTSELGLAADIFLDVSVSSEACPHDLAPTASTTVMLALGDALAMVLSSRRGFSPQHFADLHPGGQIGRRLTRVRDVMHFGSAIPLVNMFTPMSDVIYEMSSKKLGMTTIVDSGADKRLLGMISDGDLRRLLEQDGAHALDRSAGDIMNRHPVTIDSSAFVSEALALMEDRKITSLIVGAEGTAIDGIVHIHDLWQALGSLRSDAS